MKEHSSAHPKGVTVIDALPQVPTLTPRAARALFRILGLATTPAMPRGATGSTSGNPRSLRVVA